MIVDLDPYLDDGDCVLYHGDAAYVLPALGVKADLILTSPPYDDLRTYGGHGFDFDDVADSCVDILADGGVLVWVVGDAVVDGSETGTSFRQALGFMERGLRLHDTMIYEKSNPVHQPKRYAHVIEYMFVFSKEIPKTANLICDKNNIKAGRAEYTSRSSGRNRKDQKSSKNKPLTIREYGRRTNIWRYAVGLHHQAPDYPAAHDHPAIFPLALAADHIRTWTNPGDLVIDPMAGSGTVLKAARQQGRQSIGVEIHDEYLPLIRDRMAQQTLGLEVA